MGISEVRILEFRMKPCLLTYAWKDPHTSQVTLKLCPGMPSSFTNEPFAADSFFILSAEAAVASDSVYPKSTNLEVWPRLI